jgi:hypothetical protein
MAAQKTKLSSQNHQHTRADQHPCNRTEDFHKRALWKPKIAPVLLTAAPAFAARIADVFSWPLSPLDVQFPNYLFHGPVGSRASWLHDIAHHTFATE